MINDIWRKIKGIAYDFWEQIKRGDRRELFEWLGKTLKSLPGGTFKYRIFVVSLDKDIPALKPRLPVTIRLATEVDLDLLKGMLPPSQLYNLLHIQTHDRLIFLAFDGELPVSYCWATPQVEFTIDNIKMHLQPGDIYGGMAYTLPDFRGQGIQTALQLFRMRYLKELGYKRVVVIVEDNNQASLTMHRKIGFTEADRLIFRRILWKRIYHYQDGKF
jgi:ribosomal protein S18 acetylase RimI-like enzyme